jgi:hypothetical protein
MVNFQENIFKQARIQELQNRLICIRTLSMVGNSALKTAGVCYCGRNSSRHQNQFDPKDLGLGNPFSHKNTSNCVWQVNSLTECLASYRTWLWKLIQNQHTPENLEDWEILYLYRFLNLCQNLDQTHTLVCFCINGYHNAVNKTQISCHTQILWNASVWCNCQKLKL